MLQFAHRGNISRRLIKASVTWPEEYPETGMDVTETCSPSGCISVSLQYPWAVSALGTCPARCTRDTRSSFKLWQSCSIQYNISFALPSQRSVSFAMPVRMGDKNAGLRGYLAGQPNPAWRTGTDDPTAAHAPGEAESKPKFVWRFYQQLLSAAYLIEKDLNSIEFNGIWRDFF